MKRGGSLPRRTPLRSTGGPRRAAIRRTPDVPRDWSHARRKVEREGACRVCRRRDCDLAGSGQHIEAAHTIGREHDRPAYGYEPEAGLVVAPPDVVPLCTGCHRDYDDRRLDLLPHLNFDEMAAAVAHVGIVAALRRLTSRQVGLSFPSPSAA